MINITNVRTQLFSKTHAYRSPSARDGVEKRTFKESLRSFWVYLTTSVAVPLMPMYFLMLLINTVLRDTKDTILVTLSHSGVEAIPFLKTWLVIPSSMAFFLFYSRLSRRFLPKQVFVMILSLFILFFIAFAIFIFPSIAPTLVRNVEAKLKSENDTYETFLILLNEWPLGLFFIVCELWSSGVCQVLFWQAANDVMSVAEAKAIYPAIGAMGNLGMVVAGHVLLLFADQRDLLISARAYLRIPHTVKIRPQNIEISMNEDEITTFPLPTLSSEEEVIRSSQLNLLNPGPIFGVPVIDDPTIEGWTETLSGIALLLVFGSACILVCYDLLHKRKHDLQEPEFISIVDPANPGDAENQMLFEATSSNSFSKSSSLKDGSFNSTSKTRSNSKLLKPKKPSMTLRESLLTLSQNEAIKTCAILVISYGITSCLVEVTWKAEVKAAYNEANDYSRFMAKFWFCTGVVSMIFMVLGRYILPIEGIGYKIAVLFTPLVEIFAGFVFFSASVYQRKESLLGSTETAAYAGGFLVMMAKSAKYAFFDTTKEMIFISLDQEAKSIGKAAIELVAYRLAKSGGSLYLQVIILFTGQINSEFGLLLIGICFFTVCTYWISAAFQATIIMRNHGHA